MAQSYGNKTTKSESRLADKLSRPRRYGKTLHSSNTVTVMLGTSLATVGRDSEKRQFNVNRNGEVRQWRQPDGLQVSENGTVIGPLKPEDADIVWAPTEKREPIFEDSTTVSVVARVDFVGPVRKDRKRRKAAKSGRAKRSDRQKARRRAAMDLLAANLVKNGASADELEGLRSIYNTAKKWQRFMAKVDELRKSKREKRARRRARKAKAAQQPEVVHNPIVEEKKILDKWSVLHSFTNTVTGETWSYEMPRTPRRFDTDPDKQERRALALDGKVADTE